jgi:hypothetical protein
VILTRLRVAASVKGSIGMRGIKETRQLVNQRNRGFFFFALRICLAPVVERHSTKMAEAAKAHS